MASPSWLDDAAAYATCATLTTTGATLVGTGVSTLWAGGGGLVPLSLGMLSFLGAGALCGDTPVDGNTTPDGIGGCYKLSPGGFGKIEQQTQSGGAWFVFSEQAPYTSATEITKVEIVPVDSGSRFESWCTFNSTNGIAHVAQSAPKNSVSEASRILWRIAATEGTCAVQPGDPKPLPPTFTDPVQYTNPTTNCTYNVSPRGFAQVSEGGQAGMVFKIEAAGPQTLASGGVIGGCNFEPTLVFSPPGGGPPTTTPWNPDWPDWDGGGDPPWLDVLKGAVGGAAAAAVGALLDELFQKKYPETSKSIYAACQYKEDGTPEEFTINFPEQTYQDRVLDALTAQVDFAQQFFLWKSPICSATPQPVTGDAVSINWVSDEYSPNGNNRIRKLLTYFDQAGSTLEQTVAHWKDFTWQAGPVIVSCVGTPLGKPQVWAASEAEAKRVINHAAAIADVDLKDADWLVAPPKSSRYGMAGTMRIHRGANGALGITKRDGPNGLPPALT